MGYSLYLSFPVAFIGYASSIYYLAIKNIPILNELFPYFHVFIVVSLFTLPPLGILLGWLHYKKILSSFFKAEMDIQTEANPYATEIVSPVNLPSMKIMVELCKMHGIDTSEVEKIIQETEKKFGITKIERSQHPFPTIVTTTKEDKQQTN